MTTIELETRKALLVKDILTEIDSEEMLEKLTGYFKRIRRNKAKEQIAPPCQYTIEEMKSILAEREKDPSFITHDEVKDRMQQWMASWK